MQVLRDKDNETVKYRDRQTDTLSKMETDRQRWMEMKIDEDGQRDRQTEALRVNQRESKVQRQAKRHSQTDWASQREFYRQDVKDRDKRTVAKSRRKTDEVQQTNMKL